MSFSSQLKQLIRTKTVVPKQKTYTPYAQLTLRMK